MDSVALSDPDRVSPVRMRPSTHWSAGVVIAGMLISGCTYTRARLDYDRHSELQAVRYWTGKQDARGPGTIGVVEAYEGGWLDCDGMATKATLSLLADARRMGGNGVVGIRYENAFHMAGRPRCRRNWVLLGHMTVRATGVAVREAPTGTKSTAD